MRVHHLNCGSFCPHGARLLQGSGGLLDRAHGRLRDLAAAHGDEVDLFCAHDPAELRRRAGEASGAGAGPA